jgi:hypothetical protein
VCIDCMRTPPDLRPAAPASFRRKVAIPDTAWPSHLGRRKIHRHRTRDASQDNAHIYPGRWRVERRRRARSDPVARRFQWQNVLVTSLGARATPRPPAGPGTLPIGVTGVTGAIGLTAVPAAPCRAVPGRARGSRRDDPGGRDRGARGAAGAAAGGRPGGGAWPNHGLAGRVVPGRRRWAEAAGQWAGWREKGLSWRGRGAAGRGAAGWRGGAAGWRGGAAGWRGGAATSRQAS